MGTAPSPAGPPEPGQPCSGKHWPGRWRSGGWGGQPGQPDRAHEPRPRAGLAVVVALVQTVGTTLAARGEPVQLDPLGYALLTAGALALVARARYPIGTLAFVAAATLAYQLLDYPSGPSFVALIIAAVAVLKAGHRYPVWALAGGGYLLWLVLTGPTPGRAVGVAAWTAGALLIAEWIRAGASHRARAIQVQQERARAEEEQQRRQASEERLRIAQELHDVLGHHLSLINVQAGVGLHLMDSRPEQARAALGTIKQASAEALREVRSVLAALHPTGEAAPRRPAPGLDRIDDLTVDAGIPVRRSVRGQVRQLPPELDRAAYRIVQEALTNVRRHAGTGAAATVVIDYRDEELVVRVDDDGGSAAAVAPVTEGGGIGGMRERAAALGGSLTARPLPGGGFTVLAQLPMPAGTS